MAIQHPTAEEFTTKTYDFVIIGGGTAGLVLAARLTEDPSVSVGVIEAGENRMDDPLIEIPGFHSLTYEKPEYDWIFKTVPQTHVKNDVHGWPRGRVLGGSSAINYTMVSHPSKQDLDNWVALGNPEWSWEALVPYYKKFETYTAPSVPVAKVMNNSYKPELHGASGPIQVSFPKTLNFLQELWAETCKNLGLSSFDPWEGASLTAHQQPISMHPTTGKRSYSATGYYAPNAARQNLSVITGARASKILLEGGMGTIRATGVAFSADGSNHIVKATREVLLCAGVVQSPQMLEVSGIGSAGILRPLDIDVAIDNPGVGENLQDHVLSGCAWPLVDGIPTLDEFREPDNVNKAVEEFNQTSTGLFTANGLTATAMISYLQTVNDDGTGTEKDKALSTASKLLDSVQVSPSLEKQYKLLRDMLLDPNHAALTVIGSPGGANLHATESGAGIYTHLDPGNYVTIVSNLQHPFSRGSIHIRSKDVNEHPIIDPRYLSHPIDLEVLASGLRNLTRVIKAEPLASKLKGGGVKPGYENFTKGNYRELAKETLGTQWHPIGTCSMLPREDGGVVDQKLKVYGAENLRVIDASIFPLHVQGNIQSLVYAVAEKAADIIKADWKLS